jgi:hypothetical protein
MFRTFRGPCVRVLHRSLVRKRAVYGVRRLCLALSESSSKYLLPLPSSPLLLPSACFSEPAIPHIGHGQHDVSDSTAAQKEAREARAAEALAKVCELMVADEALATDYARRLSPATQHELSRVFLGTSPASSSSSMSFAQGRQLALSRGVPLIGFGFMDNFIMIIAGEYIDSHIGVTLGISTMAAAALGNLFSDIAGLGLGGTIESLAAKLGIETPQLTKAQRRSRTAHVVTLVASVIGIAIGCIIGMFPLLFYSRDDKKKKTIIPASSSESE